MNTLIIITAIATALGSAVTGGLYFAFSIAVMGALGRQPAPQGMAAMQSINIVILNPAFLSAFLGTAMGGLVLIILAALRWQSPASIWLIAGAVLYIGGSFLLTVFVNVPMNNALMTADPASAAGQEIWANYLVDWTFWNHIRTVASLASLLAIIVGLTQFGK